MSGIIYFAQAGDHGPIKIGYTSSAPEERLATLQTGCPSPLRLLGTRHGTGGHERYLHARFASHRLGGEWFSPADELLSFICSEDELPPIMWNGSSGPILWIRSQVFKCGQTEFAKIAGTTQPTVSRWERGEFDPDLRNLRLIRSAAIERGIDWQDSWFFEISEPAA
jgi:hypothetical protein